MPPVRIVREGQLNEEAYRIFLRNSRLPGLVEGDTRAMMASCHLAESRLGELFSRYGAPTVLAAFDECIAQTGARARELFLAMIPQGEWSFHDYLDSDGGADARPYRVDLTLSRSGRPRAPRRLALRRSGARPDQLHDQSRPAPHRLRPLSAVARSRPRRERGAAPETSTSGWRARAACSSRASPRRSACAPTRAFASCRASSARSPRPTAGASPPARRSTCSTTSGRGTPRGTRRSSASRGSASVSAPGRSPMASTSSTTSPRRTIPSSTWSATSPCASSATRRARTPAGPASTGAAPASSATCASCASGRSWPRAWRTPSSRRTGSPAAAPGAPAASS